MIDLLNSLKQGRTWQQVADLLGGGYSGAFWRLLAIGQRHATLEQENIVRAACGLPELTQSPAEAVTAAGVERVVRLAKRPNTALLLALAGDVLKATIKTGVLPAGGAPSVSVTLSYGAQGARNGRQGSSVPFMSELALLPQSAFSTARGKTGDLFAITAAAQRARVAFDTPAVS